MPKWNAAVAAITIVALSGCSAYYSHFPRHVDPDEAPQITNLSPTHGATDVSSDVSWIVVEFDRPMGKGVSLRTHGPNPLAGKGTWWGTSELRIPVHLEPGADYVIELNDADYTSFIDKKGRALVPFRWEFSTAPEQVAASGAGRFGTHLEPFDWYVPQELSRLKWVDTTPRPDSSDK